MAANNIKGFFLIFATLVISIPLLSCSEKMQAARLSPTVASSRLKMDAAILDYVNQYRQSKGLPPLQLNEVISAAAEKHSSDMAFKKTPFGHNGFEERIRTISQKLGSLKKSAENVAYGNINAQQVVDIWVKSPGHRRNIEGKYSITGIGIARAGDGTIFFTQIFAVK
ncbi:MAG: CAP domain-containing protein [Chitinophagaceae bacterium]